MIRSRLIATTLAAASMSILPQTARTGSVLSPQSSVLSAGCESCHKNIEPMHASRAVRLSCTDCHGGNAEATTKEAAHIKPKHPELWPTSANPQRSYAKINDESAEFIKFVNPGDLRVAQETCGECH